MTQQAGSKQRHVFVWGRRPPPLGGVTTSIARTTEAMSALGWPVTSVDLSRLEAHRVGRAALTGHGVSLLHASGPSSVMKALPALRTVRHPRALYVHAAEGGSPQELQLPAGFLRSALPRFSKIWATNEALAEVLAARSGRPVGVASPHVPLPAHDAIQDADPQRDQRMVTFAYNSGALYNAVRAVEVVEQLRTEQPGASLTVVTYGAETRSGEWSELADAAAQHEWLELVENTDGRPATGYLQLAGFLLRLTTTDGDSLIVREALGEGLAVVASDVVPRPAGVRLCDLSDDASILAAITGAGRVSDGAGLGQSIVEEFRIWAQSLDG